MRVLVDNTEIRSQRVAYPSPDAFEAVCQLIGVTFRHERNCGIIAVAPPLIGRRILVRAVDCDPQRTNSLLDILKMELRLLEQLLWISGADVTLDGVRDPVTLQARREVKPGYWDIALFVYPERLIPGGIDPLVVYPWWRTPLRGWRLAGHLAAASEMAGCLGFKRATTWRLPSQPKQWFSHALSDISAPAVLVSIPLVAGHVEPLLDNLSLAICQGVLSYFRKTPVESWARDALRQLPAPEGLTKPDRLQTAKGVATSEDADNTAGAVRSDVGRIGPHPDGKSEQGSVIGAKQPPIPRSGQDDRAGQPILKAVEQRVSPETTTKPDSGSPVQGPSRPQEKPPLSLREDRRLHSPPTRDDGDELEELRQTARRQRAGQVESAAYPQRDAIPPAVAPSAAATPGSGMKREDACVTVERELPSKSTEESRRSAYESLSSRGIKPTQELIDEYLLFLQRMASQPENENGSEDDGSVVSSFLENVRGET